MGIKSWRGNKHTTGCELPRGKRNSKHQSNNGLLFGTCVSTEYKTIKKSTCRIKVKYYIYKGIGGGAIKPPETQLGQKKKHLPEQPPDTKPLQIALETHIILHGQVDLEIREISEIL